MSTRIRLLTLISLFSIASLVAAQQADTDPPGQPEETTSDTKIGAEPDTREEPASIKSTEPYFRPTEDISEDLSVSFPVDI